MGNPSLLVFKIVCLRGVFTYLCCNIEIAFSTCFWVLHPHLEITKSKLVQFPTNFDYVQHVYKYLVVTEDVCTYRQ